MRIALAVLCIAAMAFFLRVLLALVKECTHLPPAGTEGLSGDILSIKDP